MILEDLISFRDSEQIFAILKEAGGQVRFVGGCVRNSIMNLPLSDIDIATTLLPDQIEQVLRTNKIKTIDIGKDHGTIIAVVNGHLYEITTLRKDVSTDGRRAVVAFSNNWQEDALRRDFTINAMSYCPDDQKLYDYFGGMADLKAGIIRFVGVPSERVQEDYLRILRLFRFYTYYGQSIDQQSLDACIKFAHNLEIISAERKHHELKKILEHPRYRYAIGLMHPLRHPEEHVVRREDPAKCKKVAVSPMDGHASLAMTSNHLMSILDCVFNAQISDEVSRLFKKLDQFEYVPSEPYMFRLFVILYHSVSVSRHSERQLLPPDHSVITTRHSERQRRISKDKEGSFIENLHCQDDVKLTNTEKKYLKEVLKIIKMSPSKIKSDLYELIYENRYFLDAIIFLFLDKEVVDLSLVKEVHCYSGKKLSLPIDGDDIKMQFSIKEGKEVGKLLKLAMRYWCKSKYTVTKQDITKDLSLHRKE